MSSNGSSSRARRRKRLEKRYFGTGNGGKGWTLAELEVLMQQKIHSKCSKPNSEYQEAFKLFGRPQEGFDLRQFRNVLAKLGIQLSREESHWLFSHYDSNGNGKIDFAEFTHHLTPQGWSKGYWNFKRDAQIDAQDQTMRKHMLESNDPASRILQRETSFPKSLEDWRWPVETIEKMVQDKIISHTARPTVQAQDAFKLFGRPRGGIPPEMFQEKMATLGLDLRMAEVKALFERWDQDGTGTIDFHEFIVGVMPQDYPQKSWNVVSDEKADRKKKATKNMAQTMNHHHVHHRDANQFPDSLKRYRWSLEELEQMVQEKIASRCHKANSEKQDAFKLFDRPKLGITSHVFKRVMRTKLGLHLHEDEVNALFDKWDEDKSGMITFKEFINHVMKPDYTVKTWNQARDEANDEVEEQRKRPDRTLRKLPVSMSTLRPSMEELERQLQAKINQNTERATTMTTDAYKLFGRPQHGISKALFRERLASFGMVVTREEADALFDRYDTHRNGILSFAEFVKELLPQDYTAVTWNVQRDLQKDQRKLEHTLLRRKYGMGYHDKNSQAQARKNKNKNKSKSKKKPSSATGGGGGIGDLLGSSGLMGAQESSRRPLTQSQSTPRMQQQQQQQQQQSRSRARTRPSTSGQFSGKLSGQFGQQFSQQFDAQLFSGRQSSRPRSSQGARQSQRQATIRLIDPWEPRAADLPAMSLSLSSSMGASVGFRPKTTHAHPKPRKPVHAEVTLPPGRLPFDTVVDNVRSRERHQASDKMGLSTSHISNSFIFGKQTQNKIDAGKHGDRMITETRPGDVVLGLMVSQKVGDCKVLKDFHTSNMK